MLSIIFQMGNPLLGQYFEEYYSVLEALSKSRIRLNVDNIVIYIYVYTKMSTSHQKVTGKQHVTVIKYVHHFFCCSWFERTPKNKQHLVQFSHFPRPPGRSFLRPVGPRPQRRHPRTNPLPETIGLKDAAAAGLVDGQLVHHTLQ